MLLRLLLMATLVGLGGALHCAAMCGTACGVLAPRLARAQGLFGRSLGYGLLGGVVACAGQQLTHWAQVVAPLRPLWILSQAAALMLGLWVLWQGRMPASWDDLALQAWQGLRRHLPPVASASTPLMPMAERPDPASSRSEGVWRVWRGLGGVMTGMLWAALPCGLLYAALTLASLANTFFGGAIVMVAFSLPGAVAVWATPAIMGWVGGRRRPSPQPVGVRWLRRAGDGVRHAASGGPGIPVAASGPLSVLVSGRLHDPAWAVRVAALSWVTLSAYGLQHQIAMQWRVWCGS